MLTTVILRLVDSLHHSVCVPGETSPEGSDLKHHAEDRENADQQQYDGREEGERRRKPAFTVDQARLLHLVALLAQSQHELDMIDDAADEHDDTECDKRDAEIASRARMRDDGLIAQFLEHLEYRKAEADQ